MRVSPGGGAGAHTTLSTGCQTGSSAGADRLRIQWEQSPHLGRIPAGSMKFSIEAAISALGDLRRKFGTVGGRVLRRGAGWGRILVERPERTAPVVVTVLIGVSAAAVGVSGLESLNEQGRLRDQLAAEVEQLEQEATGLRESIASLRQDPAAFEVHAKTYHQLVEPGEVVVLLQPPGPGALGRAR